MPMILRDQIWQFVGATFGLLAIIVSIVLYWTQRRRKALSYDIISRTPLLSVEDEIKGKLEIYFHGKPVQDIHLVVLKLINSGNVPIVSTDYERPVNLSFGEEAQIFTTDVIETNPDNLNLHVSYSVEATKVELVPLLLNSGDSITFKVLVSQLGEISVDGRIVGVKEIRKFVGRPTGFREIAGVVGVLSFLITALLILTGSILQSLSDPRFSELGDLLLEFGGKAFVVAVLIPGAVLMFVGLFRDFKKAFSRD